MFNLFLQVCILPAFLLITTHVESKSVIQLAQDLGATTLVGFIKQAGLEGTLSGHGPFTVFAPNNAAFAALPNDVKAKLANDTDLLKQVLTFHVTSGRDYSTALSNDMLVASLNTPNKIRVNIYQTVDTQIYTVDGATIVTYDQNATNGVIHVIDKVMFPIPMGPITSVAALNPNFGTLIYCLQQGQLLETLSGAGPFTVFAPNNAAFDKLPPNALSDLLSNQTALVAVLKYHVIGATYFSQGLNEGDTPTLEGKSVHVTFGTDGLNINNAQIVTADVPATNGVVHEIDTVLFPPN
ncbi:transforming growth factor-beta-induced protein ig-h3-like isoform X2 [Dreissena polymorpha]|uniref:transforming growth factor-beta-induced protein ig-h3-like isoform X2 n=1 Tax=Dreissena polymorpha TaxID=45954 RepID=UPI002264B036|nr:transforming growth factor-beta-induced protein ig-h3-like isoform X2 [Dreissena polymorpha]